MDAHQNLCIPVTTYEHERKTDDNVSHRMLPVFPIQLTNTIGTYLEHLNEDCLLEIFSSNSLTIMDLCSLAETCIRFKEITERVFPKNYWISPMYPYKYREYEFRSENGTKCNANLRNVERILKNFGSHLTRFTIWSKDQGALVNLVGMYCGDVTLNHLDIYGLKSIGIIKMYVNSIFQRLQKLYILCCHFDEDLTSLDLNGDSLIELKIRFSSDCDGILKQTFPKLERFYWRCSNEYGSIHGTHLYQFIRRHGHLKTIKVFDGSVRRNELLHVIDSTCNELEKLSMEWIRHKLTLDFSTQGGLSKLKILDLEFDYNAINDTIPLMRAVKSLETMKISNIREMPLEFFDALSQLQNLRELYLTFCPINCVPWTMLTQLKQVHLRERYNHYNASDLLNVVIQLINLEELICIDADDNFYLSKEDFTKIIEIVERREHVLTIKCCWNFKLEENCNKNHKVKLIKQIGDGLDSDED